MLRGGEGGIAECGGDRGVSTNRRLVAQHLFPLSLRCHTEGKLCQPVNF